MPGLYSRLLKRRKKVEQHEKARDDMVQSSSCRCPRNSQAEDVSSAKVLAKQMKIKMQDSTLACLAASPGALIGAKSQSSA